MIVSHNMSAGRVVPINAIFSYLANHFLRLYSIWQKTPLYVKKKKKNVRAEEVVHKHTI